MQNMAENNYIQNPTQIEYCRMCPFFDEYLPKLLSRRQMKMDLYLRSTREHLLNQYLNLSKCHICLEYFGSWYFVLE